MLTGDVLKFGKTPKTSRIGQWINFFSTARGKTFSNRAMTLAAFGISGVIFSYQTFFIDNYLDFIRAYRSGMAIQTPEELELLVDKAADRIKLSIREATYLKTFVVGGFEIGTVGSMNSSYSGWIGLPISYMYRSPQDIDKMNIQVRTEPIDWNSKYGELLENSLLLTEEEKLFGMMRSILELKNYNHVHSTLVPAGAIFGLYTTAQAINKKYNLYQLPRPGRILIYGVLSIFTYGIYSFVTDTIRFSQVSRVDKALVALGSDVIEAGITFYEKLLNKHVAIRELSGKDLYSVKGNEYPGLLRYNVFPLTTRKLFLQNALKEARKKEAEQENDSESVVTKTEDKINTK